MEFNPSKSQLLARNKFFSEQEKKIIELIRSGKGNFGELQEKFFIITGKRISKKGKISFIWGKT